MWKSAFGSGYDLGMTLFYYDAAHFHRAGGGGAVSSGVVQHRRRGTTDARRAGGGGGRRGLAGLPWPLAPVLATLAAVAAGAIWGVIPGWLRARRGSHEVINTIMLNFVAAGLASYVTLYLLKNPDTQNPETRPIGAGYLISQFEIFGGAPVSMALPLAIVAAGLVWFLLWRTVIGFEMRAVGQNESAARAAGINTGHMTIIAMAVAGGLAGLVGVGEVLGNAGKFRLGFSPEYGFIGIAVALLGRNQPAGVVAAALLFGALHKGTADLDWKPSTSPASCRWCCRR
jgi:general nucleoside transport system permease protein